jgi:rhodanese-related sulfurtransferase
MGGLWRRLRGEDRQATPVETDWDAPRLRAALADGQRPYLLDVRTEAEFRQGHLPGAQLLPLHGLRAGVDRLPRDRTIVCICRSGHRSAVAAAQLRRAGLQAVSLRGGMLAWPGPVTR